MDSTAVMQGISDGVARSWPLEAEIMRMVYAAIADNTWTVLPPGSHLVITFDDPRTPSREGATVVAMRERDRHVEVLTDFGRWVELDRKTQLRIGGSTP